MQQLATEARAHAENLADDISNASTRIEHIRLTQLALEAERLAVHAEELAGLQVQE